MHVLHPQQACTCVHAVMFKSHDTCNWQIMQTPRLHLDEVLISAERTANDQQLCRHLGDEPEVQSRQTAFDRRGCMTREALAFCLLFFTPSLAMPVRLPRLSFRVALSASSGKFTVLRHACTHLGFRASSRLCHHAPHMLAITASGKALLADRLVVGRVDLSIDFSNHVSCATRVAHASTLRTSLFAHPTLHACVPRDRKTLDMLFATLSIDHHEKLQC